MALWVVNIRLARFQGQVARHAKNSALRNHQPDPQRRHRRLRSQVTRIPPFIISKIFYCHFFKFSFLKNWRQKKPFKKICKIIENH